jgi:hypothetical protein
MLFLYTWYVLLPKQGILMTTQIDLVFMVAMGWLCVCGLTTLILTFVLWKMHNVRNKDGQYAWMIPQGMCDLQDRISASQEKIAQSMTEMSVHNGRVAKLLESLVNATLSMHQDIKSKDSK